ncbi:iron-containing alcohol dehydrogenase [Demetria terragena]|uniref:iron-containing alcohol dehydrogenase n=1 Tax=Demetria terragena TaxID=63959 RepID=UPI0003711117|nr:iron-containing alcohol dehydrogenase [Demetria terragena]
MNVAHGTATTPHGVLRMPRQTIFGSGAVAQVAVFARELGRRVFVVTDEHIVQQPGVRSLLADLESNLMVEVYDRAEPELPIAGTRDALTVAQAMAPDVIVAVGGGSSIDLAKVVAVLLQHGGSPRDFYGENMVPGPGIPVIAVPTTSGTGSEVSPVAVIADDERQLKVGISSPHLVPEIAVVDPTLTRTCPSSVTAHSGLDALAHAVESTTARPLVPAWDATLPLFVGRNVLAAHSGVAAAGLVSRWLIAAVNEGQPAAREGMAEASLLAGMALGTGGTTAAHALQYPIGAMTHTPHGLGVGLLLPYVLEFNLAHCTPQLARVGREMDVHGVDDRNTAALAIDRVAELVAESGTPTTLREIGIDRAQLPEIAEAALAVKRLLDNNPRPCDRDDLVRILQAAWSGERSNLTPDAKEL